jgi:hypothetical protein
MKTIICFRRGCFLLVDGVAIYMDKLEFNMDGAYVCNSANSLGKLDLAKSSYGRLSMWLHHKIEKKHISAIPQSPILFISFVGCKKCKTFDINHMAFSSLC